MLTLRISSLVLFLCSIMHLPVLAKKQSIFSITAIPVWHEFANRHQASEQQVILCCKINIKRRGNPVHLRQLSLQWRPNSNSFPSPSYLTPLLYEPKYNQEFKPISSALLANGTWHHGTLSIHFPLNYKLVGKSTFYIIIHATPENCQRLRRGRFFYTDDFLLSSASPKPALKK